MSESIVIASAARTPVGSFNGAFANTPAHDLGSPSSSRKCFRSAGVDAKDVDEVIMATPTSSWPAARRSCPGPHVRICAAAEDGRRLVQSTP
jgi:acetyl-CoA acetyltransferase